MKRSDLMPYHCLRFLIGGRSVCTCGQFRFDISKDWWAVEDRDIARRVHAVHKKKAKIIARAAASAWPRRA